MSAQDPDPTPAPPSHPRRVPPRPRAPDTVLPRVAVVMPVGPGTEPTFVADTIEAIDHYTSAPPRIVLVDVSGSGIAERAARDRDVELVTAPGADPGGPRYLAISHGFARALEQPFDVLLRLDTDATVIGAGWDLAAWSQFWADVDLGVLGNHLLTYDGTARDLRPAQEALATATARRTLLTAPGQRPLLRQLESRARQHGRHSTEHVLGGMCVYSHTAITRLRDADLLGRPELARAPLGEDHLFGLLLCSLGLALRQFGTRDDGLPCAVADRGLPDSPEALLAAGKSLVHSTRYAGRRHEGEIRAVFAARRRQEAREGLPPARAVPASPAVLDLRVAAGSSRGG